MNRRDAIAGFSVLLTLGILGGFVWLELAGPKSSAPGATPERRVPAPQDDEKYRVKPVDEPAMPVTAEEAKKAGYLTLKGGGYQFERKDGAVGVAVPGTILMNRGVVELFACAIGGKEHESVVRIECDIHSLDLALGLCDFKRGKVPAKLSSGEEQGERLIVLVQWTDGGKTVTHRAEDLILHAGLDRVMPRVGWTYVGDWVEVTDPMSTPTEKKTYKVLAAAASRSLMTTWRDSSTLLDNPLPDAIDDTLYAANPLVAPAPGTSVLVILRPPTKAEREEIAKTEKELSK
jgi:hypothetical protein